MGVDLSTIDESCKDETKTTKMGKILFAPAFWGTAAIGVAPPMLQFENPIGAMMETDEDKKKRKEAEKKKAEEGPRDKWKTGLDFGRRSLDALVHPDDGSAPFYHLHSGGKLGKNMRLITVRPLPCTCRLERRSPNTLARCRHRMKYLCAGRRPRLARSAATTG